MNADINPIIEQATLRNYLIGINSNRAIEDIEPFYRKLKLNGPILVENGIYCMETLASKCILLLEGAQPLQKYIAGLISIFIRNEVSGSIKMFVTDTSDYINKINEIPLSNRIDILLNKYRKYTGSVHVYKNKTPEVNLAQKLFVYLEDNLDEKLCITKPNTVANVTIQPRGSSKSMGVRYLKETFPDKYEHILVIGDSTSDAETAPLIQAFYAVSNADPETRRKATFVSDSPYTKGVGEILRHIIHKT